MLFTLPLRFHFLDMGTIKKQYLQQIPGGRRCINCALESLLNHPGKKTGMVDVCMGNQEKIYAVRLVNAHIPVSLFYFGVSLVHPAVHGKSMTVRFQNVAGTCYRPRCPHKFYFHSPIPPHYEFMTDFVLLHP